MNVNFVCVVGIVIQCLLCSVLLAADFNVAFLNNPSPIMDLSVRVVECFILITVSLRILTVVINKYNL